jgi:hypothetical protein
MYVRRSALLALGLLSLLVVVGCGSSSKKATPTAQGGGASAAAEAKATATGDIPDNQVFLTFRNPSGGYSIVYPEGWAQKRSGNSTTFQDKDNVIQIVVQKGSKPTVASVRAEVEKLHPPGGQPKIASAETLAIRGQQVVKVTYSTQSQPNPVTGKRVRLIVDRYTYFKGGRVATLELGTAAGVDNVDAFRMISRSFRWQ